MPRLTFLVAGRQHVHMSVTEGSLVHEDIIWLVWTTTDGTYLSCCFSQKQNGKIRRKRY